MERSTFGFRLAEEPADEKLASLFQPDTVSPEQYYQNFRRKTVLEPEKKLMLAVLDDAIRCLHDNRSAQASEKKKLYDEAAQWVGARGGDWIFSFDNVCEALGFSPDYLRQGLLRPKPKSSGQRSGAQRERTKLTARSSHSNSCL